MKSNLERRLRRLEASAGQGDGSILVVEKLEVAKAFESFQRGLIKTVIVTGVPRANRLLWKDRAHGGQNESRHLEA